MIKLILFFCLVGMNCSCMTNYKNSHNKETMFFEIVFQDFFSKDIVELKLNGHTVFDGELTSDKVLGVTNIRILGYENEKKSCSVKLINKSIEFDLEKGKLNLEVFINKSSKKIEVDLAKGKYIGISKQNENNVYIAQSMRPFVYE